MTLAVATLACMHLHSLDSNNLDIPRTCRPIVYERVLMSDRLFFRNTASASLASLSLTGSGILWQLGDCE
jgi:hypothetical protein